MALAALLVLAFVVAACGDDDDTVAGAAASDSSASGSDVGTRASDAAPEDLEVWQTDLNAVGCYAGAVDGSLGPQTEAAIRAFQAATGLAVDGLLGPATEGALQEAVAAGETVCGGGSSVAEAAPEDLEVWQADLNAVGCYAGAVDGSLGPQTEAAIRAFQAATGLTVDGLLGPATEGALQEAVAAGEPVCTSTTGDGGGGETGGETTGAQATLTAASYSKTFTVGSCTNAGETDLVLQAQADNITLLVDAPDGTGTLSVDGGTEGDGITLNGEVTSVVVGDAGNFTVTGVFGEPNNAGEQFTLTGSCAGT